MERMLEHALDVFAASVQSPYNFAFAASILLFLGRFSDQGRSPWSQLLRYLFIPVLTWCLGSLSDLIFPNSITWTILPCAACAFYMKDWPIPIRCVRAALLMCAWIYSLAVAEAINVQAHGGIWLAALCSLVYALAIWAIVELLERGFALDASEISMLNIVPVIIVCAVGIANRAILILRSDIGVELYSVHTLESLLSCLSGQVAELVVYACMLQLAHEYAERQRLAAERHLTEVQLEGLKVFQQSSESFHELRHEVKNQYAYIRMLLEQKEFDRAQEFFGEMSMRANPTFAYVATGNDLVDDIVNLEIVRARSAGVRISTRIAVPAQLGLPKTDLLSVLTNLLDNAIEACSTADNPEVCLSMAKDHGALLITVTNPAIHAPRMGADGSFLTSKDDSSRHGYGTSIVKQIAERSGGLADFSFKDGTFTAKAMLLLKG